MGYECKILKDSIGPNGVRLTTMQVAFPRIVLAEFNTHRVFSRNSASSRAIPVQKQIDRVLEDPFVPVEWGRNRRGMQATETLEKGEQGVAVKRWLAARDAAVMQAAHLNALGVHKQIASRLLEPFMWHTVIVSSTEWANFFALRCHKDAQPEIRVIAGMMRDAMQGSRPTLLNPGEWHMPLIRVEEVAEFSPQTLLKISAGRCARVSYLTHDGRRDPDADIRLADRLLAAGHMSPFEHQAHALSADDPAARGFIGNLRGWVQYRKTLATNESNPVQQGEA